MGSTTGFLIAPSMAPTHPYFRTTHAPTFKLVAKGTRTLVPPFSSCHPTPNLTPRSQFSAPEKPPSPPSPPPGAEAAEGGASGAEVDPESSPQLGPLNTAEECSRVATAVVDGLLPVVTAIVETPDLPPAVTLRLAVAAFEALPAETPGVEPFVRLGLRALKEPTTRGLGVLLLQPLRKRHPGALVDFVQHHAENVLESLLGLLSGEDADMVAAGCEVASVFAAALAVHCDRARRPMLYPFIRRLRRATRLTHGAPEPPAINNGLAFRLGRRALAAVLAHFPDAKYRLFGVVEEEDSILPVSQLFVDAGRNVELMHPETLMALCGEGREVIVLDPSSDPDLKEFAASVLAGMPEGDTHAKAKYLAQRVEARFGGSWTGEEPAVFTAKCEAELASLTVSSRAVMLGQLKLGVCRHRSIMYKFLADHVGIGCRLVRDKHAPPLHAWNVVCLKREDAAQGLYDYYVVDLMNGANLLPQASEDAVRYRMCAGGPDKAARPVFTTADLDKLNISDVAANGAFGQVYFARRHGEPESAPQSLAVKVTPFGSRVSEKTALREVEIMSVLKHPCLVSYKAHLLQPTSVVVVMERGEATLDTPLEPQHVLGVLFDIAWGMAHLHGARRSIGHRDLKPANIIIFPRNEHIGPIAKVGDFGTARVLTEDSKSPETEVYTPGYAAPEQRYDLAEYRPTGKEYNGPVGLYSDVFSFGQLMGFAYTKESPKKQPPPLHLYSTEDLASSGMPPALVDLYKACTNKSPGDRPLFAAVVDTLLEQLWGERCHQLDATTAV